MAAPTEAFPAGESNTGGRYTHSSLPGDPSSDVDSYGNQSSIGLGLPPPPRHVSVGFDTGNYQVEGRRRVRSVHGTGASSGRLQPPRHAQTMRRRTLTTADPVKSLGADKGRWLTGSVESSSLDEVEPGVFSDEYDLSHEDPKILEDVQRALKLKLRREARLQAARVNGSSVSTSSRSSPVRYSLPPLNPQASRIANPSLESELDFSPSVGIDRLHPVPTSVDDGATLDWGGTLSEEDKTDRKWSLSITKRRHKDKPLPVLSKDTLEKQEAAFADKISRIKAFAQPHTLKKAVITADQLRRRYAFLSDSQKTDPKASNPILTVVKWHAGLDPLVQATLEQAEPLTWLKHLRAKRPGRGPRFPWHVTSLLFEERVRAQARLAAMAMETIPEDVLNNLDSPSLSPEQAHASSSYHHLFAHGTRDHLHPSLSRRRSDDGRISFEPITEPSRKPVDDSRQSSLYSGFFNGSRTRGASSSRSSSRIYLRDLAARVRRKGNESDEASSSHPSASEENGRDEPGKKHGTRKRFFKPLDLDLVPRSQSKDEQKVAGEEDAPVEWTRPRTSLPSSPQPSLTEEEAQVDEEAEQEEYERRAELLEGALAQNQRNRYLLQRIAGGIKEYEAVQLKMSKALGLTYDPLPPELTDAFSHDPAVVTGSTRQKRGWQAVEDIHDNIVRQRNTVQTYLQQTCHVEITPPASVLDSPLQSLQQSLDALERRRGLISQKVQEVTETLARTKELHTSVKTEYNTAMAHTSSVYPELWEFGMDALTILLDSVTPFWRNYGKVIGVDAQDFLIIPWYRNEFTGEAERYPIKALPRRSFRHWVALILFCFSTLAVLILQARAACSFSSLYRLPFNASPGLWWVSVPLFGVLALILWVAVLVEMCIVGAQFAVVLWWIGWHARIVD
ncbi:hypothetical protein EDB92DRAFT_2052299 [Lactarius akahatsu]|uniref:Uncharacterized protein n=1 Tax=Lactarius akahatsu TaxID=416441 RepID=A0AAD4LL80_9AGAM|nr:hypothetical protein EDB92DRAFT_2052299 [Lactarius akahatsu]